MSTFLDAIMGDNGAKWEDTRKFIAHRGEQFVVLADVTEGAKGWLVFNRRSILNPTKTILFLSCEDVLEESGHSISHFGCAIHKELDKAFMRLGVLMEEKKLKSSEKCEHCGEHDHSSPETYMPGGTMYNNGQYQYPVLSETNPMWKSCEARLAGCLAVIAGWEEHDGDMEILGPIAAKASAKRAAELKSDDKQNDWE